MVEDKDDEDGQEEEGEEEDEEEMEEEAEEEIEEEEHDAHQPSTDARDFGPEDTFDKSAHSLEI